MPVSPPPEVLPVVSILAVIAELPVLIRLDKSVVIPGP